MTPSLAYKDYDDDPTTFNSTSMDYVPKGKVVKAYLYFFQVGARSQESPSNRKDTFILGIKVVVLLLIQDLKMLFMM
ncbi:hypothetical protein GQR36_12980 [Enterococcus termitis]